MSNFYKPSTPINSTLILNNEQLLHRNKIHKSLSSGELKLFKSTCFCGNFSSFPLINYDAWGFNIPTVICNHCFTIRSKYFLDEKSILKFYEEGYYKAHMFTYSTDSDGIGMNLDEYWEEELNKGVDIFNFINNIFNVKSINNVLEIGCGLGGNLTKFSEIGIPAFGCDYNEKYILKGTKNSPELILKHGGLEQFSNQKFSLIILSDLMEHLTKYDSFFAELKTILSPNALIYINVPGFFNIGFRKFGCSIRQFTKIEHTWCHSLESLTFLMNLNGFSIVHGNQGVKAIFKYSVFESVGIKPSKLYFLKLALFISITYLKKISHLGNLVVYITSTMIYGKLSNFIKSLFR